MRCFSCKKTGNSSSLRKTSSGAFACKDDRACLSRRLAKNKTPTKRDRWKKRGAK